MIEVERNIQVVDDRTGRGESSGKCMFTIRGARPKAASTGPGHVVSTKDSRTKPPYEYYTGKYY